MENYLQHYMLSEYQRARLAIVRAIQNDNVRSSMMMALSLNIHPAIVEHVLSGLEQARYVIAVHHMQGISVRPAAGLGRLLRELES
jgi:DNA-binding transcriptional regulator YhcF (GntR family)